MSSSFVIPCHCFSLRYKIAWGLGIFSLGIVVTTIAYIVPWGMASAIGLKVFTSMGKIVQDSLAANATANATTTAEMPS